MANRSWSAAPRSKIRYAGAITKTRAGGQARRSGLRRRRSSGSSGKPEAADNNALLARLGRLVARADTFDPIHPDDEGFHCQYDIFRMVWDEASELRRTKILTQMAKTITCPVVAIHGDWDPHPAEGVNEPLARDLKNFRFVLLKKCGHRPWIERNASEEFYRVLIGEI